MGPRVVPYTFSSSDSSCQDVTRKDGATRLIDISIIRTGPGLLLSLFGYNNGAQQFLLLFDNNAFPSAGDQALNSAALAASDNFSIIVPVSGIGFSKGLTIALSSTPAKYTATASKDITFCGTLNINF